MGLPQEIENEKPRNGRRNYERPESASGWRRDSEVEEMAVIDKVAYAELLAEALPRVIQSDSENERLIAEMERIDGLPRATREQKALSELMALLVEDYERRYDPGHAEPLEALKHLMEDRGLRQRDLVPVFGSSSVASDVLNGKREISKRHARGLADLFSVPAGIFI
jgi:HTH-type transcriptional regulator/antitoxin HigA